MASLIVDQQRHSAVAQLFEHFAKRVIDVIVRSCAHRRAKETAAPSVHSQSYSISATFEVTLPVLSTETAQMALSNIVPGK